MCWDSSLLLYEVDRIKEIIDIANEIIGGGEIYYTVLEQFTIDKYPFTAVTTYYVNWNFLMRIKFMRYFRHKTHRYALRYFRRIFIFAQTFFIPTVVSTKNYIYGRLAILAIKSYFRLFAKKKILFFWRHNVQVLKVKLQLKFQQTIKTNFGGHYPFHGRLLNYYPFFVVVFFLIICHNFNGLFFYGFSNTAFLLQNFVISIQAIVGLTFIGISMRSYLFYQMFVPSGVPTLLIPFLIVIEIISHIAKIFSLAIRLFANIMSGHILLHILTGFVFKIGKFNFLVTVIPVIVLILVFFLEYAVTLLQAYVLITLLSIYFEEHFGFTQEDKINALKVISVNGRQSYVFKQLYTLSILIQLRRRLKRYFNSGTYMNKRRKTRLLRRKKFWDYTVIAHSAITRKG